VWFSRFEVVYASGIRRLAGVSTWNRQKFGKQKTPGHVGAGAMTSTYVGCPFHISRRRPNDDIPRACHRTVGRSTDISPVAIRDEDGTALHDTAGSPR
jgi:hypothetical protein